MPVQALNRPRKLIKSLITNKVSTVLMTFLCTLTTYTVMCVFVLGFGSQVFLKNIKLLLTIHVLEGVNE